MMLKRFLFLITIFFLTSCAFFGGASYKQQQEVKNQVVELLEEEYNQPFELESFKYEYKTHYDYSSFLMNNKTYGTYYFKVKAVDNPIIIMNFEMNDSLATKESIN